MKFSNPSRLDCLWRYGLSVRIRLHLQRDNDVIAGGVDLWIRGPSHLDAMEITVITVDS
jgi:hypothetical protein